MIWAVLLLNGLIMILNSKSKYDLESTLYSGQSFLWDPIQDENLKTHEVILNKTRYRARQIYDQVEMVYPLHPNETQIKVLENYLRVDDDLSEIYKSIQSDNYLLSAFNKFEGLHLLRQDPWECLVTFICSSNNNMKRIKLMLRKLINSSGNTLNDSFGEYKTFPTPSQIIDAGEDNLRSMGFGYRAKYIFETSKIILKDNIDLKKLRSQNYYDNLNQLTMFPGVGDKVANCVMLFSLDNLNAFPVDVWINRVLRETYLNDNVNKIHDSKLRSHFQDYFGENSGYVNHYLFHSRRNDD